MHRIRTPYNYDVKERITDTSKWVNRCEPFRGYTLQELLDRHSRGLLTDVVQRKPIYHDADHSSPDMNKVLTGDLYEKEMHLKATQEALKSHKARKGKAAPKPTTSDEEPITPVINEKKPEEKK